MKTADIIGFAAIAAGSGYFGYQIHAGIAGVDFTALSATDWLIVVGLLAIGFYFAVVLS